MRVWTNGALVYSGDVPLLLSSPYSASQLAALRYVQSGDVLTLTHPEVRPHELRRLSETSWLLTDRNAPLRPNWFPEFSPSLLQPLPLAGTAENPLREWRYAVTTLGEDSDGTGWESSPYEVTQAMTRTLEGATYVYSFAPAPTALSVSASTPAWVTWPYSEDMAWPLSFRMRGWRVYRGRGGLFGFIGQTRELGFLDVGKEPDYAQSPPQRRNPFEVYEYDNANPFGAGTLARVEYPATCAYHADRMWFGGTVQRPLTLWGSGVGDDVQLRPPLPQHRQRDGGGNARLAQTRGGALAGLLRGLADRDVGKRLGPLRCGRRAPGSDATPLCPRGGHPGLRRGGACAGWGLRAFRRRQGRRPALAAPRRKQARMGR